MDKIGVWNMNAYGYYENICTRWHVAAHPVTFDSNSDTQELPSLQVISSPVAAPALSKSEQFQIMWQALISGTNPRHVEAFDATHRDTYAKAIKANKQLCAVKFGKRWTSKAYLQIGYDIDRDYAIVVDHAGRVYHLKPDNVNPVVIGMQMQKAS
jgi:hypothetical protein